MSRKEYKALVMQISGDTALLLCKGGKFMRTKKTEDMNVGDEIDVFGLEEIETISIKPKKKPIRGLIIKVAGILLLVAGFYVSTISPVKSEELMDCVELKLNIYGNVVAARGINDKGTEIIELINSGLDNDTNKPKTIQEYLESMERVYSSLIKEDLPKEDLSEKLEKNDNNTNGAPDDLVKISKGEKSIEEKNVDKKLEKTDEVNNMTDNSDLDKPVEADEKVNTVTPETPVNSEMALAKEMFGYKESRKETYSSSYPGYVGQLNEVVVTDDIFIPFWGINMSTPDYQIPNTISLSFAYQSIDELPSFDKATVYLYDLTEQKETKSEIKDVIQGNHVDIDGNKLDTAYSLLYVDNSSMTAYHTYYIKINNVTKDGLEIDNIYYVFDYAPGCSVGFKYEE